MTAGVLLFRTVRFAFGPLPAFSGLAAMMFLPTLFYWSISLLKEPLYLLAGALTLTGAVASARASTLRARILPLTAMVGGLAHDKRPARRRLRTGRTRSWLRHRDPRVLFLTAARQVDRRRCRRGSHVRRVIRTGRTATPRAGARPGGEDARGTRVHGRPFVPTAGHGLLVNPVTASDSPLTLTAPEAMRYVIRAALSFVVVPLPWDLASTRELSYLPEQLLWYTIVVLFPIGLVAGWKRDPLVAALLAGFVMPTAAALALTNGNVGTLLRLRGTIIPYVVWISAVGFFAALQRHTRTTA